MKLAGPNYTELGFSTSMGPQLRSLVESQLLADLTHCGVLDLNLLVDWSDSCLEGHCSHFLDGHVENFSSIAVFDSTDQLVADGWMEFIHEDDFFLAYWDYLTVWRNKQLVFDKSATGIPNHIWLQIPDKMKPKYENKQVHARPQIG